MCFGDSVVVVDMSLLCRVCVLFVFDVLCFFFCHVFGYFCLDDIVLASMVFGVCLCVSGCCCVSSCGQCLF